MATNLLTIVKSLKKEVKICRDNDTIIIGERINPTNRKTLMSELKVGQFNMVCKDAIAQVAAGAAILDINCALPSADESSLLLQIIEVVREVTDDIPISIDTANIKALRVALDSYCKGGAKPLVNSVSAETVRLKEVLPLIKQYGAAVIGLCLGDDGIPKTSEDRVRNAAKIIEEGAKLGIPIEDIIIDPLILTLGSEWKAGKIALDAMKMIAEKFGVNITMGASNISFGMADRPNLTAYFIAMSIIAGLTCPICNPLRRQEINAIKAADLVMAKDPYGMKWIKAFRARE